jgi:hypothetical protein
MSTINKTIYQNGVLASPDGGVSVSTERTDTSAVVDAGAMTESSTGVFTRTFVDEANDLTYISTITITEGEQTIVFTDTWAGPQTESPSLRLISQTRANTHPNITVTDYQLIELASDWLDNNYVIGPYTVDGNLVSESVEPVVQEATAQLMYIFETSQGLIGNQKRNKIKEKLGEYEVETELEYEATSAGTSMFDPIYKLMYQYQTKPLKYSPRVG